MKLSEAIRAGAKLRPQARGDFFTKSPDGLVCSCALGAALEAVGVMDVATYAFPPDDTAALFDLVLQTFPEAGKTVPISICGVNRPAYVIAANLNDHYGHTREAVAFWLKGLGL